MAPLLTEYLPKSEAGSYETLSVVDGVPRIAGYKAVRGLPLVMLVSFAQGGRAGAMVPASLHVRPAWFPRSSSSIFFGTLVLVRQTNALTAKTRALAKTNVRFDAALSNMPHGLSMFDADERLLVSNSRYNEMYELTEEQVKPGTPLSHILSGLQDRGNRFQARLHSFRAPRTGHGIS